MSAEALREGADIVLSGRSTDTAQYSGPLIYEFGWGKEEWDKLASGILVGHLLECSGQGSGGNFSGDWENIKVKYMELLASLEILLLKGFIVKQGQQEFMMDQTKFIVTLSQEHY